MTKHKLCSDCYQTIYKIDPDMDNGFDWYTSICDRCEHRTTVFTEAE